MNEFDQEFLDAAKNDAERLKPQIKEIYKMMFLEAVSEGFYEAISEFNQVLINSFKPESK